MSERAHHKQDDRKKGHSNSGDCSSIGESQKINKFFRCKSSKTRAALCFSTHLQRTTKIKQYKMEKQQSACVQCSSQRTEIHKQVCAVKAAGRRSNGAHTKRSHILTC